MNIYNLIIESYFNKFEDTFNKIKDVLDVDDSEIESTINDLYDEFNQYTSLNCKSELIILDKFNEYLLDYISTIENINKEREYLLNNPKDCNLYTIEVWINGLKKRYNRTFKIPSNYTIALFVYTCLAGFGIFDEELYRVKIDDFNFTTCLNDYLYDEMFTEEELLHFWLLDLDNKISIKFGNITFKGKIINIEKNDLCLTVPEFIDGNGGDIEITLFNDLIEYLKGNIKIDDKHPKEHIENIKFFLEQNCNVSDINENINYAIEQYINSYEVEPFDDESNNYE